METVITKLLKVCFVLRFIRCTYCNLMCKQKQTKTSKSCQGGVNMTSNAIAYLNYLENERSHLANESLTGKQIQEARRKRRSDYKIGKLNVRETRRHNKRTEILGRKELREQVRTHKANENIGRFNAKTQSRKVTFENVNEKAAIRQREADSQRQAQAKIYAAERNYAGTKYSADRGYKSSKYASKTRLAGTKYSSNKSLAGTKYSAKTSAKSKRYTADKSLEGSKYQANRHAETANAKTAVDSYNKAIDRGYNANSLMFNTFVPNKGKPGDYVDAAGKILKTVGSVAY